MPAVLATDNSYSVESSEGIDLQVRLAGPLVRILAYSVDSLIRMGASLAIWLALAWLDKAGYGLILLLLFLQEWFYPVIFEVYRNGQTPGKRLFNLQVIDEALTPISLGASITRNLLRVVDFFPLFYLTGVCAMSSNNRFARLGDLAAGSLVVYRPIMSAQGSLPEAESVPPLPGLDSDTQRAIIDLTLRHTSLSHDRQRELADILSPLTNSHGDEALTKVRGMGLYLLGEQRLLDEQ